uniref:ribonuclease H n=1 Tax=Cyprinus carpio TaxID=7962 RepID=A0A8C1X488_CYPCA
MTIPVSFYNEHLSHQPVQPLHVLLHVEGAAGQNVPYLGYIETTVTFPKDFVGSIITVPTLALIVPDVRPGFPTSILIGMNTLETLYYQFRQSDNSSFQPNVSSYRAVLQTLQVTYQQSCSGHLGFVTLLSKSSVLVTVGHTVLLKGSAKVSAPASQYAVVQHPDSGLPGGLCVSSCLVAMTTRFPYQVPVMVRNELEQDIYIPPSTIIAELGAYECIVSEQHVTSSSAPGTNGTPLVFNFGESPLPLEWKERITTKLNAMSNVFSQHDMDVGSASHVKHHINLHDNTPFKHRARPIHPQDIEAVRKHLRELLDAGVIRESESPFSSPIVVVKKKNGDIRLCIDYRKLNLQTVKDAYALPNLEESFSALIGSKWFSVLDLKSGYYQIEVNEADKPKTAFVTPLGFWEFNRMPQGVTNAPSTFQRLMEKCMGDLHLEEVLVFLDDLIIFSNTLEEHESRLLRVLSRLQEYGLKLSPEKCKFFQTSVKYLGHIVSENGEKFPLILRP